MLGSSPVKRGCACVKLGKAFAVATRVSGDQVTYVYEQNCKYRQQDIGQATRVDL
jgi:hypothetical protein